MPCPWNDGIMECWNDKEKKPNRIYVHQFSAARPLFHYSIFPIFLLGEAQLLDHSVASVNTKELARNIIAFVRCKEDKGG